MLSETRLVTPTATISGQSDRMEAVGLVVGDAVGDCVGSRWAMLSGTRLVTATGLRRVGNAAVGDTVGDCDGDDVGVSRLTQWAVGLVVNATIRNSVGLK